MRSSRDWGKGDSAEQAAAAEELRATALKAEAELSELRAKYASLEAENRQLKTGQNDGGFSLEGGAAVSESPPASADRYTPSGSADRDRGSGSPSGSQGSSSSRLSGSGPRSSPRARWSTDDKRVSSPGTSSTPAGAAEERRASSPRLTGAPGSRIPRPAFISGGKASGSSDKRLS